MVGEIMTDLGYRKSKFEPYIFHKNNGKLQTYVTVKGREFSIKDLGEVKSYLGLSIARSQGIININLRSFVEELLKKYKMEETKPVSTPMVAN
ncbi:hypothetical protein PR048_023499 [Dryococelus australis]|uniref:Reverse transcriptase Ty1/copia-type domain-containing protein n=1 Tax=Dryococelus australis TaxID=614101 RepID=A0ABQ9GUC3_9NEOP|nr:hypothetical protein PR048_023499 [Dryococelus australis]